jgi:hypothetical protein
MSSLTSVPSPAWTLLEARPRSDGGEPQPPAGCAASVAGRPARRGCQPSFLIRGRPWGHPTPPQLSSAPRAPAPPPRHPDWSSRQRCPSPTPPQFAVAGTSSGPSIPARPSPPVCAADRGTRSPAAHPKASSHERRPPLTAASKSPFPPTAPSCALCLVPRPSVGSWGRAGAEPCGAQPKPEPEPHPRRSPATPCRTSPWGALTRAIIRFRECLGVFAVPCFASWAGARPKWGSDGRDQSSPARRRHGRDLRRAIAAAQTVYPIPFDQGHPIEIQRP